MTDLATYLHRGVAERWQWGVRDCCTFPADWAINWGLGDPMQEWRGKYASEAEARAFIADAGGLTALWDRGLARIGVAAAEQPYAGDIAVIAAMGMNGAVEHVGAIWTGRRWAFRAERGLAFASAEILRCWGPRHG